LVIAAEIEGCEMKQRLAAAVRLRSLNTAVKDRRSRRSIVYSDRYYQISIFYLRISIRQARRLIAAQEPVMRFHYLNAGTMYPIGRRLVNDTGSIFQRARMVCDCLLIETNDGLALVDIGIGLDDIANPPRLGPKWVRQTTPRLDPAETAVQQVKALGYSPSDVRHLLLTHLDRDHAGGIPYFLYAKVHVHQREHDMAVSAGSLLHHRSMEASAQWSFYGGAVKTGPASRACARSATANLTF
jgi:hypothetical protein